MITEKRFREDLFFRINVIPIHLPPLRERLEDIPLLVNMLIKRLRSRTGKRITGLSPQIMDRFMSYAWPGNVRELKSALEYAFVIAEQGLIDLKHLPPQILSENGALGGHALMPGRGNPAEKAALINALRQSKGNQFLAARMLGVNRVTVWNRMKKYGIDVKKLLVT